MFSSSTSAPINNKITSLPANPSPAANTANTARLPESFQSIRQSTSISSPSSSTTNATDRTFTPGSDGGIVPRHTNDERLHIGDLARARLSRGLKGDQRTRAVNHGNRIDAKFVKLMQIADYLKLKKFSFDREPVNFHPLANSLITLRNAWYKGSLVESSRYIRVSPPDANHERMKLEHNIDVEADNLAQKIHANIPDEDRTMVQAAMDNMKRMKV